MSFSITITLWRSRQWSSSSSSSSAYLPSRNIAWAVLAAAFLIVLPFQTAAVGDAGNLEWTYWVVQVVVASLGAGLVALGARWRAKRKLERTPRTSAY